MDHDKMIYTLSVLHKFSSGEDKEALGMALDILGNFKNEERIIKADFLSTDELVDYLEKNNISMADIVGTFQEEIFKSYGTPVYKYILIYQIKEGKV